MRAMESPWGVDGVARALPWDGGRRTCAGRVPHQRSTPNKVTPSRVDDHAREHAQATALRREGGLRRHVHLPSPPVVEMLGHLGFDWMLLDNEHGSITVDTAEACIGAAELSGMAPIVRPVRNKAEIIAPFLDRGAWGVQ